MLLSIKKRCSQDESSSTSSVKANFIYNFAYQLLVMVTPLITAPYLSRVLGAEGVGSFSYTYSIANYFVLFAMLGINNHGCRVVARAAGDLQDRSRSFAEIYSAQLVSSLLSLACYVCITLFGDLSESERLLSGIWTIYVLSAAFDINWFFFGMEMFRITVIRNAVIKISIIVLMFLFVRTPEDLAIYTTIYASGCLVSQLVLWPFVRKVTVRVRPGIRGVVKQLKSCLVLFIPVISVSFYTSINTLILGAFGTMTDVAVFDYAARFIGIPSAIVTSLGTVMMPRMVSVIANNSDKAEQYIRLSIGVNMMLLGAFSCGLIGISHDLSTVFLGPGFEGCEITLILMAVSTPFVAWANVLRTQYLIPLNRDRSYIFSVVAGGVANILLALLLVERYGAYGMAAGYTGAQIVVCVAQTVSVRGDLPLASYVREGGPFLVIGLLMAVVTACSAFVLPQTMVGLIVEIIVGAVAYSGLVALYALFSGNETSHIALETVKRVVIRITRR